MSTVFTPTLVWRRRAPGILRTLGILVAVLGTIVTLLAWPRGGGSGAAGPADASALGQFDARFATGSRQDDIAYLQGRLRTVPGDWRAWAALGGAYLEEARVTFNPTYYPKAEGALRRSLDLEGGRNDLALAGLGMLANARHDFAGGLAWGERAKAVNPDSAGVYGVIGDALVELGRYDEAFAAMQRMVDLRPGLPSYSRVAYARELQGDADGAMRALELAAASASNPSDAAFVAFQQGELQWNNGALAEAAAAYARAVRSDASFLPAKAALARLHAASGEPDRAVAEYQAVLAVVPAPQYVIELGDLYASRGRLDLAGEQTDLLRAQEQLFRANGVNVDLEVALFDADHHVDLDNGLTAARAEYGRRQSISAADALAWQLHANGRDAEALPLADDALRLGTGSALFHFHRGVIELGLHDVDAARADLQRALSLNPHFSLLHAPEAARLLESLGTTGT